MSIKLNQCCCLSFLLTTRKSFNICLKRSVGDAHGLNDTNDLLIRMVKEKGKFKQSTQIGFPSSIWFTVLGNGSLSNPRAVLLRTQHHKYLFNCGEGTLRAAVTLKTRITGLHHVFITHCSWNNICGLPAVCLAVNQHVTAHGPLSYDSLAEITRTFDDRNEIKFSVNNDCETGFKDPFMKIDFIPIYKKSVSGDDGIAAKRPKYHLVAAFVYIGRFKEKPGKWSPEKCMELKVPGPLFGKLKAGEDVTLKDGRLIKAEDVREPTLPGSTFMVLECPSMEYFDSLASNEKLCQLFQPASKFPLDFIFHFSPVNVVKEAKFQEWMSKFPETVSHIGLNEYNSSLLFSGANIMSQRLRLFEDKLFVNPHVETQSDPRMGELNLLPAPTGLQLNIYPPSLPKVSYQESEALKAAISPKTIQDSIENRDLFEKEVIKYKQEIKLVSPPEPDNGPSIIFLGTGSATPGNYRTASSIIIETAKENLIMLDCGEGTFGQFHRFYGKNYAEKLRNLNLIFVSHHHADHQLGLVKLLQQRAQLNPEPVFVICSFKIERFLLDFYNIAGKVSHLCYIALSQTYLGGMKDSKLLKSLNLSHLQTVRVQHCRDSFGIVLKTTGEKPRKIVYSGDAMPTQELIIQGEKCDLLIHEATLEDALSDKAALWCHSTFSQAIEMGKSMNAGFTLLTHFSRHYDQSPKLPDDISENVGLAFDNMRVKFSDLHRLEKMRPVLEVLFKENSMQSKKSAHNRIIR